MLLRALALEFCVCAVVGGGGGEFLLSHKKSTVRDRNNADSSEHLPVETSGLAPLTMAGQHHNRGMPGLAFNSSSEAS